MTFLWDKLGRIVNEFKMGWGIKQLFWNLWLFLGQYRLFFLLLSICQERAKIKDLYVIVAIMARTDKDFLEDSRQPTQFNPPGIES